MSPLVVVSARKGGAKMKKTLHIGLPLVLAGLLVFGVLAILTSGEAVAKGKPGGGGTGCPRTGIACADVYIPVICSDGVVYSNSCYAYVACATGCVPYGDSGPIEVDAFAEGDTRLSGAGRGAST